jgi:hypothetical protein
MSQIIPAEHDARQFELICQSAATTDRLFAGRDRMHRVAGDRTRWIGKTKVWSMNWAEVSAAISTLIAQGDERDMSYSVRPSQLVAADAELLAEVARLDAEIDSMESTWRAHRWQRYFPCLNGNGHIHASLSGCPTVNRSGKATSMGWATELSGKPVSEAIQMPPTGLGPRLCSVCFPDAPVEHCRTLSDITREQRAADKLAKQAERDAAAAAKADRQAARAAKAEQPRKQTPQERRWAAMKYLTGFYPDEAAMVAAGREKIAMGIEGLAPLGQSSKWQDAIAAWAKAVRDEENSVLWAFTQYSVPAAHAA